jgi:hypothetical protein
MHMCKSILYVTGSGDFATRQQLQRKHKRDKRHPPPNFFPSPRLLPTTSPPGRGQFARSSSKCTSSTMTDLSSSAPARCLFNNCNSEASNNKFAFLVHSQDTLPNNLPPKVDDKPLARQKRRRTRFVALLVFGILSPRVHAHQRCMCIAFCYSPTKPTACTLKANIMVLRLDTARKTNRFLRQSMRRTPSRTRLLGWKLSLV